VANIIIPGGDTYGKTRSEQEKNLQKDWGGSMSEEQLDKMKFFEKKRKEKFGFDKQFVGQEAVDTYFRNVDRGQAAPRRLEPDEMKKKAEQLQEFLSRDKD